MMMRAAVKYLNDHEFPINVRFFCEDPEKAHLYRTAYNYWFAPTEEEKMK